MILLYFKLICYCLPHQVSPADPFVKLQLQTLLCGNLSSEFYLLSPPPTMPPRTHRHLHHQSSLLSIPQAFRFRLEFHLFENYYHNFRTPSSFQFRPPGFRSDSTFSAYQIHRHEQRKSYRTKRNQIRRHVASIR